jgi:peroxiredoxin
MTGRLRYLSALTPSPGAQMELNPYRKLLSMNKILTISCFLTLVGSLALAAPKVGQPAPAFSATDIEGKQHKLADYKGKIVVLEAYNYDCPFCANHYKGGAMQGLQEKLVKEGVVWLIVNSTAKGHASYRSPEAAKKEWARHEIKASAWIDDSSGKLGRLYGMRTTPHLIVIDQNGRVAYDGAIDDNPSASGDPRKAKNYVQAAAQQLLAGESVAVAQTKPYGCSVKYGK